MTSNPLTTNTGRQVMGAAAGMLIATVFYVVLNDLPSMQVSPALLIGGNPTISTNAGRVRVNDKTVESDNLKRIAARAQQVAAQMDVRNVESDAAPTASKVSPPVVSVPVAVQDRADRSAWLAMREAQRKQNAAFDLSVHAAASVPVEAETTVVTPHVAAVAFPEVNDGQPALATTKTPLPNSGMGLNLIVFVAFILAVKAMPTERRRTLIGR